MVTDLHPPAPAKVTPNSGELRTLIDDLIAEQGRLQTPVARFAETHGRQPDLAEHYRHLIPLTQPGAGEQYAFEVALDRCTGCKACVSACHNLNGLDDDEAWRDTGTLIGGSDATGWQQTITSACHHCEDPGCLNGCPVGAYEKDRNSGIVRHLDDQCIGCSYCILKCPFDVPKYSKKRGIVRKCDMCHQRLAEGEAPACVQACPTEAIRIVKVPATAPLTRGSFLNSEFARSGLPQTSLTRPTTRYTGRTVPESAIAADRDQLVPQHAHWPLVFMLVLTQAGIGLLGSAVFPHPSPTLLLIGAVLFNLGMIAATLHLGQPLKAWRFFLGLRTSWLSREILAFSMFGPIPFLLAALPFLPDFPFKELLANITAYSVVPTGLVAIFTSVMIYHDTHRSLWRFPLGACRFFGTMVLFLLAAAAIAWPELRIFATFAIMVKMIPEARVLRLTEHPEAPWSPDLHSARVQRGPLRRILNGRVILASVAAYTMLVQPWAALAILLISELLERQLFFQSVQAPKMPGRFGPPAAH